MHSFDRPRPYLTVWQSTLGRNSVSVGNHLHARKTPVPLTIHLPGGSWPGDSRCSPLRHPHQMLQVCEARRLRKVWQFPDGPVRTPGAIGHVIQHD